MIQPQDIAPEAPDVAHTIVLTVDGKTLFSAITKDAYSAYTQLLEYIGTQLGTMKDFGDHRNL